MIDIDRIQEINDEIDRYCEDMVQPITDLRFKVAKLQQEKTILCLKIGTKEITESKKFYQDYCKPCNHNTWEKCLKNCPHRKELRR